MCGWRRDRHGQWGGSGKVFCGRRRSKTWVSGVGAEVAIEIDQEAIIACGQQIVAIEDFESLKGQVTNGSSMDRLEHLKLELEFEFEFKFK